MATLKSDRLRVVLSGLLFCIAADLQAAAQESALSQDQEKALRGLARGETVDWEGITQAQSAALYERAERYLDLAPPGQPSASGNAPRKVVVSETRNGKFQQTVSVGPHRLVADEPVAAGGNDTGPGPYDLVLAGLGACTSMTMRMYADRKSLPLERVTVTLDHSKIHAEDCAECETRVGMLDQFDRVISMEGALDAEQRKKLMEIADKCPVHRTLKSEIRIVTRAAD